MTSAARAAIPLNDPGIEHASVGTGRQVSQAIDIVAWLAEEAEKVAGRGAKEFSMSQALHAAVDYMVEYLHHVSIDHDETGDALVKAARGPTDLTAVQLDFLRLVSRSPGRLAAVPGGRRGPS